jgi:hypothetical protein
MSEMVVVMGVGVGVGDGMGVGDDDGVGDAVGPAPGVGVGDEDGGSDGVAPGAGIEPFGAAVLPAHPLIIVAVSKATLKATKSFNSLILGEQPFRVARTFCGF